MNAPLQTNVGKYHLVRKIATGGMAEVYLAQAAGPAGFTKTLVLKRILPHLAEDQQFVEMFLNEARLAAVLNHPNIVQIFDLGEAAGSYFIAMEYIDGPNLRSLCRRAVEKGRVVPYEFAAKILGLACEGLHYAHEFAENGQPLNLIHRDISPDNVLISRTGAVKVVDFGIAKAANQGHLTKTGTLKGKLAYMPPEQLRGKPLDRRADVFALGVVLYELLAGMKPFDATSEVAAMQAILHDPPIPLAEHRPDVPDAIVRIITRALEKDRENRYPDCRSMQQDLERFVMQAGTPIGAYELAQLVNELVPPAPIMVQHTPLPKSVPIEIQSLEPVELTGRKTAASAQPPLPPPARAQHRTPASSRTPPPETQTQADAATLPSAHAPNRTLHDEPQRRPSRGGGSGAILAGVAAGGVIVLAGVAYLVVFRPPTPPAIVQPAPVAQPIPVAAAPVAQQVPVAPAARAAPPEAPAVADQGANGEQPAADAPVAPEQPAAVAEKQPEPEPEPVKPTTPRTPDRRNGKGTARPVFVASAKNGQREPEPVEAAVKNTAQALSTGTLIIETDPPCQVTVDGKLLGTSPVTASELAPGPHNVVIANREKGLQRRMSYSVSSGETRREKLKFGSGTIVFRVRPWANVEIDGKAYGVTPLPAPVTIFEGEHRVRLYNPELRKEWVRTLWIVPDKEEIVKANLEE